MTRPESCDVSFSIGRRRVRPMSQTAAKALHSCRACMDPKHNVISGQGFIVSFTKKALNAAE